MTFETFLRHYDAWTIRELQIHLHEQWPQLNLKTNVVEQPGFEVYVDFLDGNFPKFETETVYVPRLDFKGRLLLCLGALFDSAKWWNAGFTAESRPRLPLMRTNRLKVELQHLAVRQVSYDREAWNNQQVSETHLFAGYCAYNDTLYIRR